MLHTILCVWLLKTLNLCSLFTHLPPPLHPPPIPPATFHNQLDYFHIGWCMEVFGVVLWFYYIPMFCHIISNCYWFFAFVCAILLIRWNRACAIYGWRWRWNAINNKDSGFFFFVYLFKWIWMEGRGWPSDRIRYAFLIALFLPTAYPCLCW